MKHRQWWCSGRASVYGTAGRGINPCPVTTDPSLYKDAGLQLRKSEENGFHDNFLISQQKPYDVTLIEIVSPRRLQRVVTP